MYTDQPVGLPNDEAKPLAGLTANQVGRIARIEESGADTDRLKALGLCRGQVVGVVCEGDPMVVKVFSTRIALSADLAGLIYVEYLAEGAA